MNTKNEQRERNRARKIQINFRVDEDELKYIQAKMLAANVRNREAFVRKMVIDGVLVNNDYSDFENEMRRCNYLVSNIANNINQIAKRVNTTRNVYDEDIREVQKQMLELRKIQVDIMKLFVQEVEE